MNFILRIIYIRSASSFNYKSFAHLVFSHFLIKCIFYRQSLNEVTNSRNFDASKDNLVAPTGLKKSKCFDMYGKNHYSLSG